MSAQSLPKEVLERLRVAGIPASAVAAVVRPVDSRAAPSLSVRADAVVNPASLMKLVTTYSALELLGPAYRWKTEAYFDGALRGEVLEGNLVLRGSGDPKLTYEAFWLLLRALRARGLRELRGDLVVDRSHFAQAPETPIDDDSFRPYNVAPDALLVNFKSLRFTFLPDLERNTVRLAIQPQLPGLELVNGLRVVERSCPEGRAFRELVGAAFRSQPPRAAFTGVYPASCGVSDMNVALHAPQDYVAGMVRHLWAELGGTWSGTVRDGRVPPTAQLVFTHESEPLSAVVRDINKFSNNVMARQLFLTLAAERGGAPAEAAQAGRAIREWLAQKGIAARELSLENGSGLSRTERISAGTLAAILQAAWRSPVMPELVASLPLVAADGTMRKRLHGSAAAGHAHIKTGLLHDVRAIAGFVLDRHGQRHVAVMIVNHARAHDAQPALDALVEWAYENGSRGPARPRSRRSAP